MKTVSTTEYMIRVQFRRMGKPGNERHINCSDLDKLWGNVQALKSNPDVYKIEVYSLLERTIITL